MEANLPSEGTSSAEVECLQNTLDKNRETLEVVRASPGTQSWLRPCLNTTRGTEQLYSSLQQYIGRPAFLEKLTALRKGAAGLGPRTHGREVAQAGWWELQVVNKQGSVEEALAESPEEGLSLLGGECLELAPQDLEPLDSWQVVEREDILDAIGTFVAAYLANLPEADNLQPKELQEALQLTFKQLRKGRIRRLWDWGRFIYRSAAISYSAFSMYENPWLVRAVLAALWTSSRILLGMLL